MNKTIRKLRERIAEKSILAHPFYQAWAQGQLTILDLQRYAPQYRRVETEVAKTFDALSRHFPQEDLLRKGHSDECGHVWLWLNFCEALGLDRTLAQRTAPFDKTSELMAVLAAMRSNPSHAAVAAYVIESQNLKVAEAKRESLIKYYNFDPEDEALLFFDEHMAEDPHHAQILEELIVKSSPTLEEAFVVCDLVLEGMWDFLTEIYQGDQDA